MQTGVVSQDNLADVLRGISQRRRQGVLEIATGRGTYRVSFVQGRIVEIRTPEMTPVQDLVTWLTRGGYPCQPWELYPETTYQELFVRLQTEFTDGTKLAPEVFSLAVLHRVLERLYRLELGNGSLYTFRVQMVEVDNNLAPSISVGQLLLDIVEMEGEAQTFGSQFPPHSVVVPAVGRTDVNLPTEEERVLKVLHDGCSIEELEARSLLSSHTFRHALLELRAHDHIAVRGTIDSVENPPAGELSEFLDSSIDAAFAVDFGEDLNLDAAPEPKSAEVQARPQAQKDALQEEAHELAELEQAPVHANRTWRTVIAPISADLLQSTLVPGIIATAFLIMALAFPLVSWTPILSFFADR